MRRPTEGYYAAGIRIKRNEEMTESQFKLGIVQRCTDIFWEHNLLKFPKPIKNEKHLFSLLDELYKKGNKQVVKIKNQLKELENQRVKLMAEYQNGSIEYRRRFYPRLTMRLNKIKDKKSMLEKLLK